ncbi:8218_t:CDS:2, partial [Dentiscutata erythropus]
LLIGTIRWNIPAQAGNLVVQIGFEQNTPEQPGLRLEATWSKTWVAPYGVTW